MRIGIVTQSFYPARGGIAENALHTALTLQRRGHVVTVITTRFTPFDEDRGLDVRRIGRNIAIPANGAFVNITIGRRLGDQMKAIERECRFDVVQIHSPLEPFLPMEAINAISAPKVGLFHSYVSSGRVLPYDVLGGHLRKYANRLTIRAAVSGAARDFINSYFPGEYRIVPNGVDIQRFSPDCAPVAKHKSADFTVVFVGRMDPRKGLRYLLKAFPRMSERFGAVRLVVVGGGILLPYFKRALPAAYRSKVFFEGYVPAQDLPGYYAVADVVVLPAVGGESFGIVLLEALATGKALVASNIPGYNALIAHERDGLLVPAKDSRAIAEAVIRLHENPGERQLLGAQGRVKALEYSWEKVTDTLEKAFQDAVRPA